MGIEKIKKNDFIELEFLGKAKDGDIFDTNIPKEAEKIGLKIDKKPFILCIGQEMVIKGLDKALEDKEISKQYTIELFPKDAFQERKSSLVKLIPLNIFAQQKISPRPGMTLALDNMLVKVISVSGGRVLADFNNPLSGKIVIYEFTIKRKVDDINEKIQSVINYFIRKDTKFEVKDKKIILDLDNMFSPLLGIINNKFKDVLGLEFSIKK
ncbi:MAG: FKBP-type peptidyl-prolyl cis-trans isomerase [Nanoarchaeota archaeon]